MDNTVSGTSYPIGMGRLNASIPMKCIAQIPVPIETAPPINQTRAESPLDAVTRVARSRAVYDAKIATSTDINTIQKLYVAIMCYIPKVLMGFAVGHRSTNIVLA